MTSIDECLCCGSPSFKEPIKVREMMFGTREVFDYHQCRSCQTIQLLNTVDDLSRYYPPDYWFPDTPTRRPVKDFLRSVRASILLTETPLTAPMAKHADDGFLRQMINYGIKSKDRILEVGCGTGSRLITMSQLGFRIAHGVDPFIPKEINENGIFVRKAELSEIKGAYDFIIFHHSFEHVPDPLAALRHIKTLLAPTGSCVIRIPTCSSDAFDEYGANWVQLDAPRHYFIPSRQGMSEIGKRAGLSLTKTIDDSNGLSFWGSEQYKRDLPLRNPGVPHNNHRSSVFSQDELAKFEERAQRANRNSRGDQAAFVFSH